MPGYESVHPSAAPDPNQNLSQRTTAWKITKDVLIREEIHAQPVMKRTTWNIAQVKAEIAKNEEISKMWLGKNVSLQQILDKYDEHRSKQKGDN